jgi:hypothetical protein
MTGSARQASASISGPAGPLPKFPARQVPHSRYERTLISWAGRAELTSTAPRRVREKSEPARRDVTSQTLRAPAPYSRRERTLMRARPFLAGTNKCSNHRMDLSWLTILSSRLARRCDLHVPGSREQDLVPRRCTRTRPSGGTSPSPAGSRGAGRSVRRAARRDVKARARRVDSAGRPVCQARRYGSAAAVLVNQPRHRCALQVLHRQVWAVAVNASGDGLRQVWAAAT